MAIDKAIEYKMQGGVKNYRPSKMVTAPRIAKSSPDTPTAKLAYITPEEQDILIDLNLYGSLKGKPNRGPSGIPSLEGDFGGPGGYGGYQGGGGGRQDNDVSGSRDRGTGDYRVTDRAVQDAYNKNRAIREANERAADKLAGRDPRLSGGIQTNRGPMGRMGGIFGSILGMMMGIPGLGLLTGGFDKLKGGLGSLNETLGDFREKTTGFRTQKEYEDARTQRQLQGRLDNMYDRKSKGKGFSQKNIDMLEAMGLSPSTAQNVLTGRDLKGFTPSRMGLQTIDKPTQTFSFDSSGMMKNQPTMMEEFYSNLDNRVTGPNIVPNASDLAIQAKTFNTPEALMGMAGATEPGTFFGTNLSDQGKALEAFRNSAVNFYNSPNNPAKTAQGAYNFMMGTNPTMFKDVKENKSFIQDAINQGFLQTEDDYANQVPLDQIDLKDGGLASMFTRRG
jgi:hypothetical protein